MKKRQSFILATIGLSIITAFLVISNDKSTDKENTVIINRSEIIDLRGLYSNSGNTYADLLVNEIPEYKNSIKDFTVAESYSPDYVLTEVNSVKEKITLGYNRWDRPETEKVSAFVIRAHYISASTKTHLDLTIYLYKSAEQAKRSWVDSLYTYSGLPALSEANGIVVGDIAVGYEHSINFLRGNVHVWSMRAVGEGSAVEAAKELDEQIIRALEDTSN